MNDFIFGDNYWIYDNALGGIWGWWLDYAGGIDWILSHAAPQLADPVVNQVFVGAGFLTDTLNASGNVSTELGNAGTSLAVLVTADNYFDAGPFRLLLSASDAEDVSYVTNAAGVAALLGVDWIYNNVYPLTAQNFREIDDLEVMAMLLFVYEDVWCAGITAPHYVDPWVLTCDDNDAFVSVTYQARPGLSGGNVVHWDNAEMSHLHETEEGVRVESLLHNGFGVPY